MATSEQDPQMDVFSELLASEKSWAIKKKELQDQYGVLLKENNKLKERLALVQKKGFILVLDENDVDHDWQRQQIEEALKEDKRLLQIAAEIYKKDFEEEREARARAHGEKDELRQKFEQDRRQFEQQIQRLKRKLSSRNKHEDDSPSESGDPVCQKCSNLQKQIEALEGQSKYLIKEIDHAQMRLLELDTLNAHQKEQEKYTHQLEQELAQLKQGKGFQGHNESVHTSYNGQVPQTQAVRGGIDLSLIPIYRMPEGITQPGQLLLPRSPKKAVPNVHNFPQSNLLAANGCHGDDQPPLRAIARDSLSQSFPDIRVPNYHREGQNDSNTLWSDRGSHIPAGVNRNTSLQSRSMPRSKSVTFGEFDDVSQGPRRDLTPQERGSSPCVALNQLSTPKYTEGNSISQEPIPSHYFQVPPLDSREERPKDRPLSQDDQVHHGYPGMMNYTQTPSCPPSSESLGHSDSHQPHTHTLPQQPQDIGNNQTPPSSLFVNDQDQFQESFLDRMDNVSSQTYRPGGLAPVLEDDESSSDHSDTELYGSPLHSRLIEYPLNSGSFVDQTIPMERTYPIPSRTSGEPFHGSILTTQDGASKRQPLGERSLSFSGPLGVNNPSPVGERSGFSINCREPLYSRPLESSMYISEEVLTSNGPAPIRLGKEEATPGGAEIQADISQRHSELTIAPYQAQERTETHGSISAEELRAQVTPVDHFLQEQIPSDYFQSSLGRKEKYSQGNQVHHDYPALMNTHTMQTSQQDLRSITIAPRKPSEKSLPIPVPKPRCITKGFDNAFIPPSSQGSETLSMYPLNENTQLHNPSSYFPKPKPRKKSQAHPDAKDLDSSSVVKEFSEPPVPMKRKNLLEVGLDDEIQEWNSVADSRKQRTNEHAPFNPDLKCVVCDRKFRFGESQKCGAHIRECLKRAELKPASIAAPEPVAEYRRSYHRPPLPPSPVSCSNLSCGGNGKPKPLPRKLKPQCN